MEYQLDADNKSLFFHTLHNYTITDINNYSWLLATIL